MSNARTNPKPYKVMVNGRTVSRHAYRDLALHAAHKLTLRGIESRVLKSRR